MLKYILLVLLPAAPCIAWFYFDDNIVWHVDKIATKTMVIILLAMAIHDTTRWKRHFCIAALVVTCLVTVNQLYDIMAVDIDSHLILIKESYHGLQN